MSAATATVLSVCAFARSFPTVRAFFGRMATSRRPATQQMWNQLSSTVGWGAPTEPPPEPGLMDELSEMSSLTMKQRLGGFFLSMGMGITFIVIAMSFVPMIAVFGKKFAFFFSCGNFFCVASTAFLVGPAAQAKKMFEAQRAQAATAYVVSLSMTLVAALHWRSSILSIVFASVQVVAVVWYALSYIPYARHVISIAWSYVAVIVTPILSLVADVLWRLLKCCCRSS